MRFEFVKKVDGDVQTYEGKRVKTGDVVEFSPVFSQKAIKNPDFKAVAPETVSEAKPKRKYTRKVKSGDEG